MNVDMMSRIRIKYDEVVKNMWYVLCMFCSEYLCGCAARTRGDEARGNKIKKERGGTEHLIYREGRGEGTEILISY